MKNGRLVICERCQRSRTHFAKNMCRSCYQYVNESKKRMYCPVCKRENMPYGGRMCRNCIDKKSVNKNNSDERKRTRAEREKERRERLGDSLRDKERARGVLRRKTAEWKEKILKWQRDNKAWLKEYRKQYRKNKNEKVKTWDQNKRVRKMNAGKLSPEEWISILKNNNYACYYCGKKEVHLEQEHKTPLIRGGKHDIYNVVPACRECNARKHKKTEEEFKRK